MRWGLLSGFNLLGDFLAALADSGGVKQVIERRSDAIRSEASGAEGAASADAGEACCVVWLIVCHRHDELRHSGAETLAEGADTAMVDKGRRAPQQRTERCVLGGVDGGGEIGRELTQVASDEDPGLLEDFQRGAGGGEEAVGLHIAAAGGKDDGRLIWVMIEKG